MHQLHSITNLQDLGQCIVDCIVHLRKSRLWMVKTDGEFATIFTCFWQLFNVLPEKLQRLSFSSAATSGTNTTSSSTTSSTKAYDGVAF
jgi:hypothetical protein